ncbi:MAG: cytochrome c peroxidase [Pseudomonadota bacterium]
MKSMLRVLFGILGSAASLATAADEVARYDDWSERELALIQSLSLESLGPLPPDPSNAYADDPDAAALGERIFFDPRFSANGKVSCSTCHRPDYGFSDPNARSVGIGVTERRSMPIVGMAYQTWFAWDGGNDSLWSQSLEPFENPVEHGFSRIQVAQTIAQHYGEDYQEVFGPLPAPDKLEATVVGPNGDNAHEIAAWKDLSASSQQQIVGVFVNIGKALAAYLRRLQPERSAFDHYAEALRGGPKGDLNTLTASQKAGLRLFLNQGSCVNCHNGPLFTNGEFHSVGLLRIDAPDQGRATVIDTLPANEFGFFSIWSDADPSIDGSHLKYMDRRPSRFRVSFKTPSLRGVATRPPYMHAGQFSSLSEVLSHYRAFSGTALADENFHADLSAKGALQIEAFLQSLDPIVEP